jgi:hypothetical protein
MKLAYVFVLALAILFMLAGAARLLQEGVDQAEAGGILGVGIILLVGFVALLLTKKK